MTSCNDDELVARGGLVAWELRGEDRETVKALCARIFQLTEQLKEARQALRAVHGAMLSGGDGAVGDYGWSITKLNKARPLIRSTLSKD